MVLEPLKAVGFWPARKGDTPYGAKWRDMPDPRGLVRWRWRREERSAILDYLRGGWVQQTYRGYSHCRFRLCRMPERRMGHSDLTDGEWVWPEGLAHYVEQHAICLPDEWIEAMKSRSWDPRRHDPGARQEGTRREYDYSLWIDWGRRNQRRRWLIL